MATCSVPEKKVNIEELLNIYIQNAEELITKCQQLELKDGKKLEKKCISELKYLQSLRKRKKTRADVDIKVQEHDLKSSNLSHFAAIIHAANNLPKVRKILRPFSCKDRADSMVVDVVAQDGRIWVKVIARKAQALHLIWAGKGQYGDRDIVRQAEDYLKCASEHPINFVIPEVHYAFYNEVTDSMAGALEIIGIKVWGTRIPVSSEVQYLVDTSANMSDTNLSDTENISSSEDFENDDSNDDDSHIPCASEFRSKCQLKHLKNIHISERNKKSETEDLKQSDNLNGNLPSNICSAETLSDNLFSGDHCSETDAIQTCEKDDAIRKTFPSGYSQITKDEILSQILGSAPVYSFSDNENNAVICDKEGETVNTNRVNLDITTMITLVSSITHGGCNFVFKEKILSLQAEEERDSPVLPDLHKYLKDKELFVCRTALDDFHTILDTLGGESEKQRAKELLEKCTVVSDQPSLRSQKLPQTGKIRDRSKIIFGTGDQLKCVTVSANSGFVRAAEHQGIVFAVYLHQSRALTEKKETLAERIEDLSENTCTSK